MAHQKFRCEVLTPEGQVFDDEVEQISTRTAVGSIGILAGHQPLLAMAEPTELRLYKSDSDVVSRFFTEARAVNDIRHPNIVEVTDIGDPEQQRGDEWSHDARRTAHRDHDQDGGELERDPDRKSVV